MGPGAAAALRHWLRSRHPIPVPPLTSPVVLITGASSGIGRATAERLAASGAVVYGAARRLERLEALAGVRPIPLDITDAAQVSATVERVLAEQGRLDVLINNAGYGQFGPVEETPIAAARRQFEVNLFGLAQLTQLVIPVMRAQGSGSIVNISSMGGRVYTPLGAWYHATKHALEGWSDCLRIELEPMGIRVILIEPGVIATEFITAAEGFTTGTGGPYAGMLEALSRAMGDPAVLRRSTPPERIAATIERALAAKRPKARYAAGYLARPLLLLRRFGGDRLYDLAVKQLLR